MNGKQLDLLLVAIGYGCFQAANSANYLTAMGAVSTNLGFVTQLPFMIGGCIGGAIAAFALAAASRRSDHVPGNGFLIGIYLLYALTPLLFGGVAPWHFDEGVATVVAGIVRGVCTSTVTLAWVALIVRARSCNVVLTYIVTFILGSLGGMALRAMGAWWVSFAATATLLLASLACGIFAGRRHPTCPVRDAAVFNPREPGGRSIYAAWLCVLVCEFVVGTTNTAVYNSSFSSMIAGVDMGASMLAAVAVLAVLFAAFRSAPDPTALFKGCMPLFLVVFSAMPFFADSLGAAAGYVTIASYDLMSVGYSIYFVEKIRSTGRRPYLNAGIQFGVSNLVLLAGLGTGIAFNALWSQHGVPLPMLLALMAIYPIGIAFLFVQRTPGEHPRARGAVVNEGPDGADHDPAGNEDVATGADGQDKIAHEYYEERHGRFVERYGLTPRESQVCSLLVRGRSVKYLSEELGITQNTAWTHIKNLYAKCGVGTKQELITLFDQEGRQG